MLLIINLKLILYYDTLFLYRRIPSLEGGHTNLQQLGWRHCTPDGLGLGEAIYRGEGEIAKWV